MAAVPRPDLTSLNASKSILTMSVTSFLVGLTIQSHKVAWEAMGHSILLGQYRVNYPNLLELLLLWISCVLFIPFVPACLSMSSFNGILISSIYLFGRFPLTFDSAGSVHVT